MEAPMNLHDKETGKRTARLFRNGRSQAVRIPKEMEFEGEEVLITPTGDGRLMLEPVAKKPSLLEVLATLEPLPEEDWMPEIEDFPPEPVDLGGSRRT
jgi:antitoxin VapB